MRYRMYFVYYKGGNTSTKVGVAGDSAGATSAASICLALKNSLDFQVCWIHLVLDTYELTMYSP